MLSLLLSLYSVCMLLEFFLSILKSKNTIGRLQKESLPLHLLCSKREPFGLSAQENAPQLRSGCNFLDVFWPPQGPHTVWLASLRPVCPLSPLAHLLFILHSRHRLKYALHDTATPRIRFAPHSSSGLQINRELLVCSHCPGQLLRPSFPLSWLTPRDLLLLSVESRLLAK